MFLSLSRRVLVAAVALTILLSLAPAAQASPFDISHSQRSWFDLAWSWLSGLLSAPPATAAPQLKSAKEAGIITLVPKIGGGTTNSGSCLDPEGRPKPCF
jgi:hypothetical protein